MGKLLQMPDVVLRFLADLLGLIQAAIQDGIRELKGKEATKIDQSVLRQLEEYNNEYTKHLSTIKSKLELNREAGVDVRAQEKEWGPFLESCAQIRYQLSAH